MANELVTIPPAPNDIAMGAPPMVMRFLDRTKRAYRHPRRTRKQIRRRQRATVGGGSPPPEPSTAYELPMDELGPPHAAHIIEPLYTGMCRLFSSTVRIRNMS